MSGERSSTVRMRSAGKICARCGISLPPPHTPGQKCCPRCQPADKHRVYMQFMYRNLWTCSFMEPDLKTHLNRKLAFLDPEKIRTIVERVGNFADLQERQALDYAIQIGRGGVWLELTTEQYIKLKEGK